MLKLLIAYIVGCIFWHMFITNTNGDDVSKRVLVFSVLFWYWHLFALGFAIIAEWLEGDN